MELKRATSITIYYIRKELIKKIVLSIYEKVFYATPHPSLLCGDPSLQSPLSNNNRVIVDSTDKVSFVVP